MFANIQLIKVAYLSKENMQNLSLCLQNKWDKPAPKASNLNIHSKERRYIKGYCSMSILTTSCLKAFLFFRIHSQSIYVCIHNTKLKTD